MIWLGSKRGDFFDWITQRWVQVTGRRVDLGTEQWLQGPTAPTTGIGGDYFNSVAQAEGLQLAQLGPAPGIISDFSALCADLPNAAAVHPAIRHFYEQTAGYDLDAWAEWCGAFKPFGWLLAVLFSRRLQQLNVPLSGLDTSRGLTNEVLQFVDLDTGVTRHTAWFRQIVGTGDVLYAGFYSVCTPPGHRQPCVKVVFPLPNGNAVVIMRTECRGDGSFVLTSAGRQFGDPGFYFTVHLENGAVCARYVRSLRESIRVFVGEGDVPRADHVLTYFGATFLRLHYRMRPNNPAASSQASSQYAPQSPPSL